MTDLDHAAVLDALETGYQNVTDVVTGLSEADLMLPSGCAGWAVTDVLYHQLLDAQRALVAFATPVAGEGSARRRVLLGRVPAPKDGAAGDRARAGAAAGTPGSSGSPPPRTRRGASPGPGLRRRRRRAGRPGPAPPRRWPPRITYYGLADFTATLAVETAVHYLDLTVSLPSAPGGPASLALVRRVLDGLFGTPLGASWATSAPRSRAPGGPRWRTRTGRCWARWRSASRCSPDPQVRPAGPVPQARRGRALRRRASGMRRFWPPGKPGGSAHRSRV